MRGRLPAALKAHVRDKSGLFAQGQGISPQAGILWHQAERLVFRICQVNDGIAIARFYLCGEANRAGDRQQEIFPDQRDAPKVQGIIIGVVNNKIKAAPVKQFVQLCRRPVLKEDFIVGVLFLKLVHHKIQDVGGSLRRRTEFDLPDIFRRYILYFPLHHRLGEQDLLCPLHIVLPRRSEDNPLPRAFKQVNAQFLFQIF